MAANPMAALRRGRGTFIAVIFLCMAAFVASLVLQKRSLHQEQAAALARARTVANQVGAQLGGEHFTKPLPAATLAKLKAHTAKPPVIAVRVWTPSGAMRYSSLQKDASPPLADLLAASMKGDGHPVSSVAGNVMTTYLPLHGGHGAPAGAVEVEQSYAAVLVAAASPWAAVRSGVTALGIAMLVLLLVGLVGGLPWRRAARAGSGFVSRGEGPQPLPSAVGEEQQRLRQDLAQADADRKAAGDELDKVREQLRSDHDRAAARIEELQGELERVKAKLQESQVAASAAARTQIDPELPARVSGLETEVAELRTRNQHLEAELGLALERAREAEDLAAAVQDRVNAPEPENPLDAWAARQPDIEPAGDDDAEPGDLRSRLARAAARKKGQNLGDPQWPEPGSGVG